MRQTSSRRRLLLVTQLALTAVVALLLTRSAAAADFGVYREHRLGASTAEVMARLQASPRDLVTLHTRPALLQEVSWRPRYVIGQPGASRDSVASIVFSFIDDRLFKIAISYEPSQTAGLTRDDMVAALSELYGRAAVLPSKAPRPAFGTGDATVAVARWRDADVLVVLQQWTYGGRYALVMSSETLEAAATRARATAIAMDIQEAPAREAARVKAADGASRAAAEKARDANQRTFKP